MFARIVFAAYALAFVVGCTVQAYCVPESVLFAQPDGGREPATANIDAGASTK